MLVIKAASIIIGISFFLDMIDYGKDINLFNVLLGLFTFVIIFFICYGIGNLIFHIGLPIFSYINTLPIYVGLHLIGRKFIKPKSHKTAQSNGEDFENNTTAFLKKYVDKNTVTGKISRKIMIISPSNVTDYDGSVEYDTHGIWTQLKDNIKFEKDTCFKTSEDSSVTIQMHSDNLLKVYSSSECLVKTPEYDSSKEKVGSQIIKLTKGEITVAVSISGRGIPQIKVSDITIFAKSGLFKVIYKDKEDKGDVVVKNGLVEVKENGSTSKPIKLSGFYKVTFEKGRLSSPVQASVIQYDWKWKNYITRK